MESSGCFLLITSWSDVWTTSAEEEQQLFCHPAEKPRLICWDPGPRSDSDDPHLLAIQLECRWTSKLRAPSPRTHHHHHHLWTILELLSRQRLIWWKVDEHTSGKAVFLLQMGSNCIQGLRDCIICGPVIISKLKGLQWWWRALMGFIMTEVRGQRHRPAGTETWYSFSKDGDDGGSCNPCCWIFTKLLAHIGSCTLDGEGMAEDAQPKHRNWQEAAEKLKRWGFTGFGGKAGEPGWTMKQQKFKIKKLGGKVKWNRAQKVLSELMRNERQALSKPGPGRTASRSSNNEQYLRGYEQDQTNWRQEQNKSKNSNKTKINQSKLGNINRIWQ